MRKLTIGCATLVALGGLYLALSGGAKETSVSSFQYENVLGTSMELKLDADSDTAASVAADAAMAEIQRLNAILSSYESSSEFSRWAKTQGAPASVSPELMEVLALWDSWRARTGGALNPSAEAIARVWKRAEATGKLPTDAELQLAVSAAAKPQWQLDRQRGRAARTGGTPLRLNSFTKSYIVERAADAALRTSGIDGVVVNIGGDLVVRGSLRDRVSVSDPFSVAENTKPVALLGIRNLAVATSGNYRRGFEVGGRHYSHIVDPRTGRTAEEIVSATVVAQSAVDAGALATAFNVLSPDETRQLASTVPGVEYMLIRSNGQRIVSDGWEQLEEPTHPQPRSSAYLAQMFRFDVVASAATREPDQWNQGWELNIDFEIPQVQGFGARRPYVAVWIEDKDRFPVRTLAVWVEKLRWLPDLRAWYRADRVRSMAESSDILASVSSATRSPGKYALKWDGKDNAGKLVKTGRYTVALEASREHGGYTLMRRELNLNGQPLHVEVPPEAEIGAVSIDYRKAGR